MSGVKLLTVSEDEGEQRLDKWMKRRFPQLSQGHIEKMCRTGQIRVDSGRAKAALSRRRWDARCARRAWRSSALGSMRW